MSRICPSAATCRDTHTHTHTRPRKFGESDRVRKSCGRRRGAGEGKVVVGGARTGRCRRMSVGVWSRNFFAGSCAPARRLFHRPPGMRKFFESLECRDRRGSSSWSANILRTRSSFEFGRSVGRRCQSRDAKIPETDRCKNSRDDRFLCVCASGHGSRRPKAKRVSGHELATDGGAVSERRMATRPSGW